MIQENERERLRESGRSFKNRPSSIVIFYQSVRPAVKSPAVKSAEDRLLSVHSLSLMLTFLVENFETNSNKNVGKFIGQLY